jgi:hypothetical protein
MAGQCPNGIEEGEKWQLFSVSGEEKIPLPDGRYCWHALPEESPSGSQKVAQVLKQAEQTAGGLLFQTLALGAYAGLGLLYVISAGHAG